MIVGMSGRPLARKGLAIIEALRGGLAAFEDKPMQLPNRRSLARALLALGVVALVGCAAPTVLNTQWSNPKFTAKPVRSMLVVGVVSDAAVRRNFEDTMVRQLSAHGVKAEASYQYAPDDGVIPQDKMQKAVRESGAATVLLSRVVNVSQSVHVTPGMYMGPPLGYGFGGFYGYYGGMWGAGMYTPPSVYTQQNVAVDTRLFESKDFILVWSASTTTTPDGNQPASIFAQFAKLIIGAMAADGII